MYEPRYEKSGRVNISSALFSVIPAVVLVATMLMASSPATGVILDAGDFVAVRHLDAPDNGAAIRLYQSGGITAGADVFGHAVATREEILDSGCQCEDPVVWKRAEQYEPRVVLGGLPYFVPAFAFNAPAKLQSDLDGGKTTDAIRNEWVSQDLTLADNAIVTVNEAGLSWTISEPEDPPGCTNTGQVAASCSNQSFQITNQKNGQLEVWDHSVTKPMGLHIGPLLDRDHPQGAGDHGVSSGGFVAGRWNADNLSTFFYDMNEDVFVDLGGGWGMSVNNNRIVVSAFQGYSEAPPAYLASPDAVEPGNERGWFHVFEPQEMYTVAINDANVVVGEFQGNPIIMRPTGVDEKGFPTYDAFNPTTDILDELGPAFSASAATWISNSDPAYITGFSFDFASFGNAGVVWDGNTGEVIANLGAFVVPQGITDDGTIIWGKIANLLRNSVEPALWMTDDGWVTFTELTLESLLSDLKNADVPGAFGIDHFSGALGERCCFVSGVNDAGQIVAQAYPAGAGVARPGDGDVYVLDTLPLDGAVLKGDVNNDSIVDFLDITPFINAQSAEGDEDAFLLLTPDGCFLCADIDMDGAIDFLDITPFVNLLDEVAGAVPEPASVMLLVVLGLVTARRKHR